MSSNKSNFVPFVYFRLWNMNNCELLSRTSVDQKVRSCAFDGDGSHLALGLIDGSFMVLRTR